MSAMRKISPLQLTPDAEWVDLTPALAEEFLTRNVSNRPIIPRRVGMYAADMLAGDWLLGGATIQFDHDDNMIDGQHRCLAVLESGCTIRVLVVRGVATKVQDVTDMGAARSFGQNLSRRGEPNANSLASIARAAFLWNRGVRTTALGGAMTPTTSQLQHTLEAHPELREVTMEARRLARRANLTTTVFGLCYWVCWRIDNGKADFFFERLSDGQGLYKRDPIFELRRTLDDLRGMKGGNDRTLRVNHMALVFQAWNFHRLNKKTSKFVLPDENGERPEKFPEPI